MELYKEILIHALAKEDMHITFPNLQISAEQIIEAKCYKALQKIKAVIEDDSLDDNQCFEKIEQIVLLFEQMGSDGGGRHDFS